MRGQRASRRARRSAISPRRYGCGWGRFEEPSGGRTARIASSVSADITPCAYIQFARVRAITNHFRTVLGWKAAASFASRNARRSEASRDSSGRGAHDDSRSAMKLATAAARAGLTEREARKFCENSDIAYE